MTIFEGLGDDAWAAASDTFRTQFFRNGDQICAEGDTAEAFFIIWQGEVELRTDDTYLLTRRKREIVGEQALIEGIARGATMIARGEVQLILIPRATFESLIGPSPFARGLLKTLSTKLNEATSQRAFRFKNEERLFGEFRAHVAAPVLNELLAQGNDYGRPRSIEGVVLLSDIRGFTTCAADLDPIDVAEQVGRYLDHAVDLVHQHGGLVDKFIGDAILAVWGWPVSRGDEDVADAFKCATALVATAHQFSFGGAPIKIGVGLNAGCMFIGNVGSGDKRQFTVLGDVVNLAARFESMCKELQAPIVVSESVFRRLPDDAQAELSAQHDQTPRGGIRQTVFIGGGGLVSEKQKGFES